MFKRWGSWLLLLSAVVLVCVPSMSSPVARMHPDALPPAEGIGQLHYILEDGARLDLNRATLEELCDLPDVGNTLAQRIIEYRQLHGPFTDIRQIMEVNGIGKGKFEAIEPYIGIAD